MKTFICCLLFSVCCSISNAQNYVPFPTATAVWRGQRADWSGGLGITGDWWEFNQSISGDTIINGIVYHKIEETSNHDVYSLMPFYLLSSTFFGTYYTGAFREDSTKKIFYFRNGANNEDLLYDFNLTVGDSFQTALTQGGYLHVVSIDSFFDGSIFRKKFNLDNQLQNPYLIEGIGSNFGFNDLIGWRAEQASTLYCFRENNIIKYTDSTNNCSLVSVEEIQSSKSLFNLSPNPTSEILNLKSEQPILFPLELLLMDMQGKLILQKTILNNDDLSLNVKSFSNGEYLIAIKNKERILFHGIFSKQ